jgi:hypothetical protein
MEPPIRTPLYPDEAQWRWAAFWVVAAASCGHPSEGGVPGAADVTRGTAAPTASGKGADAGAPAAKAASTLGAPSLIVGRAHSLIRPTGHFDVGAWGGSVNTHTLLDTTGVGAVPVSECRFLWGQDNLYMFFYAGDLDLQVRSSKHDGPVWKDDAVTFAFFRPTAAPGAPSPTKFVLSVTPTGILSDGICPEDALDLGDPRCDRGWESHALVGSDFDGTLNKVGDFDEEWAVEVALPLRSIGVDPKAEPPVHIATTVRRCEMAHDGPRACGLWGDPSRPGELVLEDR